ncbi:MAG: CHAT domain-containing protein [Rubrivivax sp.]|nr:CHAT domain-containing protein [Rubrivivax sp.]
MARADPAHDWARRLTQADSAGPASEALARPLDDCIALAWAVKDECQAAWTEEPPRTQRCAQVLAQLQQQHPHPEIAAAAAWCDGLALLAQGRMGDALVRLDDAGRALRSLGQAQRAAQSQIPKVIALSMLGRHDDALACGEANHAQLLEVGDVVGAGKVELNLGWMLMRRDRYDAASQHFRRAAVRFARAGDATHSILADVGLASALTWRFEFEEALRLYERSAMRARARGLSPVQGIIDTNRGRLELHRGHLHAALRSLEAALREAEADGMPQDVAEARRDLGDAYLALNLLPEAIALYERTIQSCRELDAPVERAWAEVQRSMALVRLGDSAGAARGLALARTLFEADDNRVGMALADLRRALLALRAGDAAAALARAEAAAGALREAGVDGWRCEADLVAAAALAALGQHGPAHLRYRHALDDAYDLPELRAAARSGLGDLLQRQGAAAAARVQFELAVRSTELQRAALPGDEFRAAYGADKQRPYDALIELALDERDEPAAVWRTLRAIEQARAPALRSALQRGDGAGGVDPARREQLRWLHGRWQQAIADGELPRAAQLQSRARRLEQEWLEQYRRAQAAGGGVGVAMAAERPPSAPDAWSLPADAATLCEQLPDDLAIVVYALVADRLAACVVTRRGVQRAVTSAAGLADRIEQLRFQIDSLRFGAPALRAHALQMAQRCRAHLQALHALVWQPVAALVAGCERIVVVPQRSLHYVPFAALHDGQASLLERHEVSLTPSLALWLAGHHGAASPPRRVAALGVGGDALPHVAAEVRAVAAAFESQPGGSAQVLLDAAATQPALRQALAGTDVLHLACHGQFRADSPFFSALHLADGPLTVRDAADLPLRAQLVTLSACETGLSKVAPGDELLGLLRGFLLAGAPRVLSTGWTVDDAGTAQLMAQFYAALLAGARPAAALRAAQRDLVRERPHPYHWAAFALHERG